jgi:hypothetical protein
MFGDGLSRLRIRVSSAPVKEKPNMVWLLVLVVVLAWTRWPGLLPLNFSAVYALAFCAGVYFPRAQAWWVPLGALLLTDLALNCYYFFYLNIDAFQPFQLINYVAFALIIAFGRRFRPQSAWYRLVTGGVLGAAVFYLLTNTAAWFFNPFHNPEYVRTPVGWLIALTKGTAGYPETWVFFRNTLLSGGLFTGLFVGSMKLSERLDQKPAEEEEGAVKGEEDSGREPAEG